MSLYLMANQRAATMVCVMGSLLLPRPLLEQALKTYLVVRGSLGRKVLDCSRRTHAARCLSDVFDTNPIVARLRLDHLFPANEEKQLSLKFCLDRTRS